MSIIDKKYIDSLVSIQDARTRMVNAKKNNMGFAQAKDAYRNVVLNNIDNLIELGLQAKDYAAQFEAECAETMRLSARVKELEAAQTEEKKQPSGKK